MFPIRDENPHFLTPLVSHGLVLANALAWAFLQGRGYVTPQDVKDIALDVLRHRVIVSCEAESEDITPEDILKEIVETLPMP